MQRIRIKIKAFDSKVIDSATKQIIETAVRTGAKIIGPIPLPVKRSVWCVQKSPFKYGDSKEHYEMRIHKRLIDIVDINPKTIDALTHLQLASGVSLEIK